MDRARGDSKSATGFELRAPDKRGQATLARRSKLAARSYFITAATWDACAIPNDQFTLRMKGSG